MKSYIFSILRYTILLAIGIILLFFAFRGQDLERLFADLEKAEYMWVAASVVVCFLAHILRAIRWKMLIRSLGHGSPSLQNTVYAVLIGYLANLALPRMGEVSRCAVINRTDKIPVSKLIGTVIAERITDLLILCMLIALAIFLQFSILSEFIYSNILVKLTGRTGDLTLLILAFFILIAALLFFYILIKRRHWGISARIYRLFMGMKDGILSVKDMDDKAGFILVSVLIWFLYGLSTYLCFFALAPISDLGVLAALSILVFSSLAMIAPVQGGIGAFHWMVSEGLTMYGINKSDGLAYALLIHSSQTIFILFTGAISLILVLVRSSKKTGNEQTE